MVTKLYYFRTKKALLKWCRERGYSKRACEEAWTGPGYYYARSKKRISKHVPHLDLRRGHREGKGPWRHIHDLERTIAKLNKHVRGEVRKRAEKITRKTRKKVKPSKAEKLVLARTIKRTKKLLRPVREIAAYLWEHIPRKYREGKHRKWTYISTIALAKYIYKLAKENDLDWRAYDWIHEIDWNEGYGYAKREVERLLGARREYDEIPDEEIIRRLRELEEHGIDVDITIEDPVRLWELKHMI